VLSGTEPWFWLVGGTGLATLLLGGYAAMFQNDLKGLLAYSTISHLGLITAAAGPEQPAGRRGRRVPHHEPRHLQGVAVHGRGHHRPRNRHARHPPPVGPVPLMPITATLAMVASAAMAGVPLLNGFLSKEMFFAEAIDWTPPAPGSTRRCLCRHAGRRIFAVAYSLRFIHGVFFGPPPTDLPREPHEPPRWMRVPVELLVLACLVVGILPALSIGPFLNCRPRARAGRATAAYSLAVWHGFNLPLVMSLVALVGGALLYLRWAGAICGTGPEGRRSAPARGAAHLRAPAGRCSWRLGARARAAARHAAAAAAAALLVLVALAPGRWPRWLGAGAPRRRAFTRPSRCCGCGRRLPAPWARPGRPSTTGWPRWCCWAARGSSPASPSSGSRRPIWR
jgi:multicomponent K+:H+ antiporter subunit A